MKNLIYAIIFCAITLTTATAQSYQSYFLNKVKVDSLVALGGYITALPYMRTCMKEPEMLTVTDEFLFGYALFKAGNIDSAALFLKMSLQNGYHFHDLPTYKYWEEQGVFERMESHPALQGVPEMLKNNTEAYIHHPPIDSSLHARLIDARERDQRFRKNPNDKKQKPLDKRNQKFLRKIIHQYGWPTEDMVGWDGSNVAFLIAQHSDNDVEFQRQCLQFIRNAYYAGRIDQDFMHISSIAPASIQESHSSSAHNSK
ncbi:MAG: DUF6624 domain-containing protein [Bacteroidota bacterium]